jgi:hypothetical protein
MRFELFEEETIKKKFKDYKSYEAEYVKHIGCGASGRFDDSKIGVIHSYYKTIQKLKKKNYKNLNFGNGGDDDYLVADHEKKEYGFFEDLPQREKIETWTGSLTELYLNC